MCYDKIKKAISMLLCVAALCIMIMPLTAIKASAAAPELGDVDGDGTVTAADARITLRASSKLITLNKIQKEVADVDFDGDITSADARIILRVSSKLDKFPIASLQSVKGLGGGLFFIRNAQTGEYLQVEGGNSANGTKVKQSKSTAPNFDYNEYAQQWTRIEDNGVYVFIPVTNNNMRLDAGAGTLDQQIKIATKKNTNNGSQKWYLIRSDSGGYRLSSEISAHMVLSLRGGNSNPNDAVLKKININDTSQCWLFYPVPTRYSHPS